MSTTFKTPINNARALISSHTSGSGTMAMVTGYGSVFGSPSPSAPIRVTAITAATYGTASETLTIFQCTGRTGDTLTGLTVLEGTSDRDYTTNDVLECRPTAGALTDIHTAVNTLEAGTGLSSQIDANMGSTRGSILYRGASAWTALVPGTSGQVLQTGGAGADPSWATGGVGTVTSVAMTVPAWLSVAGSPITSSGTLAVTAASGQTANQVLASPNGSSGAVTLRSLVGADLPSTGLTITQWTGGIGAGVDGATINFDLSLYNRWQVALGGNRALTVSNASTGQQFSVILQQDATGSRTVTSWFGGSVLWANGTAPTLTTTANKRDVFTFLNLGGGVILGNVVGLNY